VRRVFWLAVSLSFCLAVQSSAQKRNDVGPLLGVLHRHMPQKAPVAATSEGSSVPGVVDATHLGSPLTLDQGWRVGITSDSAAADPNFDDSGWAVRDAHGSFADVSSPEQDNDHSDNRDRQFAWFRLHLKFAPNHGPIALLMELPVSQNTTMNFSNSGPGVDVFVNGKRILPEGPHSDSTFRYQQI